jgi:hypothetical protein
MYHIAPSSLHGLGLFSMDGIQVGYGTITELMEYVMLALCNLPKAAEANTEVTSNRFESWI